MTVRQGEAEKNWFRNQRFSYVNGEWYFETREGAIKGPYESTLEAELELIFYLRLAENLGYKSGV